MPVYGKGRIGRSQKGFSQTIIRKEGKQKIKALEPAWAIEKTRLWKVNLTSHGTIVKAIRDRIKKSNDPAVVLDWGCGTGRAATRIAKKFGKKVSVYGSSNTSYKEWTNNKKVKFIHATAEDILRYFKDNSIDIIYSHFGLAHLGGVFKAEGGYIPKLSVKLKEGGKLITVPYFGLFPERYSVRNKIFAIERLPATKHGFAEDTIIITRIK